MNRRDFIEKSMILGASTALAGCASQHAERDQGVKSILSLEERQKWLSPFACNIEQWFRPMPFLDRINAAKSLGFSAVEMWNPNQVKKGKTPELIAQRLAEQNMTLTSYSPSAPQMADPNKKAAFLAWLEVAISSGKTLNVRTFNLTGHKLIDRLTVEQMIENYISLLKEVTPRLEDENMIATIEPYNPFNHKGHFIYGNEPALSICREVNSPSVKLNWDFFHMQRTNGNLITNLENGFDQVAYVQFADSPGRNQPGTGEVAYGRVFKRLRELGYQGKIGAEFFPLNKGSLKAASDLAKLAKSVDLQ